MVTPAGPVISTVGPGEVRAAVVGGIHGDEPSGARAIERLQQAIDGGDLLLEGAVRLIVGNPPAVAANRRYIEEDLNRSFPGDPAGSAEARIAAAICEAIADVPTLALHATRSQRAPFAFAQPADSRAIELACSLTIPHLVLADGTEIGALSACGTVVTVEAGLQGSPDTARSAFELALEFLRATGVIAGSVHSNDPAVFEIIEELERPDGEHYEVVAENFTRVEAGEAYAIVDGRELIADEAFYPILLSKDGYSDILGFRGDKVANSAASVLADLSAR